MPQVLELNTDTALMSLTVTETESRLYLRSTLEKCWTLLWGLSLQRFVLVKSQDPSCYLKKARLEQSCLPGGQAEKVVWIEPL